MAKCRFVVRLVAALTVLVVVAATAGAMPWDCECAPELRALVEGVKKNGQFTEEDAQRALTYLAMDRSDVTAIVAFAVGESQGDDEALCDALRESLKSKWTRGPHVKLALLKKDLRGRLVGEKVEAFQALLDDPNDFVRLEAAKEIARIDPEKGKEALRALSRPDSDVTNLTAFGDAARVLYEMGEPDVGGRRYYNTCYEQYRGMMAVMEGRLGDEYERFWMKLPPELLEILEQARETGEISEEQAAYVTECGREGSRSTPQAKRVVSAIIYTKLKIPRPEMLTALEASIGERRYYGLPHAVINVALVKDRMRGKPETELVEALEPLTRDDNPYLRIEAAKEIARVRPDEGKVLLRQLYASDNTGIVQGEAARLLEKMGGEMPYGAAHRHFWDPNYFYMSVLKLIEDEPLW